MVTGTTPISQLPTGTIDALTAAVPMSINMTGTPQTIRASLQQTVTFLKTNVFNGAYQPTGTYPSDFISGLKMKWVNTGTISVSSGECMTDGGSLYVATGTINVSGAGLVSGTMYHLYMTGNNAFELSTTTPVVYLGTAYKKTGDATRRYLGTIKTQTGGQIFAFVHSLPANLILYANSQDGGQFRVLANGTATTETTVSMSGVVPPTSRSAQIHITNTSATQQLNTGNSEDSIVLSASLYIVAVAPSKDGYTIFPLDSNQAMSYLYGSNPTNGAYIDVFGYMFER